MEKASPQAENEKLQLAVYEVQRKFIKKLTLHLYRLRLVFSLLSVALAAFLFVRGGLDVHAAAGVILGAILVFVNLSLLIYAVRNSDPEDQKTPVWVTIIKFYGLFILSALYIFVCVFFSLGSHWGFLLGALGLIPACVITAIWGLAEHFVLRKSRPADEPPAEA